MQAVAGFDCSLARLKDVIALIVLAAGCSTAVCATIGVTSLCLGGAQPWSHFGSLWGLWWLGDAVGELIVAPLLLTWAVGPGRLRRSTEAAALLALLVAVSWLGFGGQSQESGGDRPWIYCMFPLVMWAALRFGSTVRGSSRLLSLQLFVGVVATSALLLSAALAERERLEQELRLRLDQLKDADRRKDEFLAMLSHELRNPLAALKGAKHPVILAGRCTRLVADWDARVALADPKAVLEASQEPGRATGAPFGAPVVNAFSDALASYQ